MSKEETEEMVRTNQRHINFWIYITVFEEKEARGDKIQKLGYKFYRDWGNDTYAYYLRNATMK
eukprot:13320950-Heterocapsa_arctica.AAC.1